MAIPTDWQRQLIDKNRTESSEANRNRMKGEPFFHRHQPAIRTKTKLNSIKITKQIISIQ